MNKEYCNEIAIIIVSELDGRSIFEVDSTVFSKTIKLDSAGFWLEESAEIGDFGTRYEIETEFEVDTPHINVQRRLGFHRRCVLFAKSSAGVLYRIGDDQIQARVLLKPDLNKSVLTIKFIGKSSIFSL